MLKTIHLAGIPVGPAFPVRIMGVINVSPESFFAGSIKKGSAGIAKAARQMTKEGADLIDVGAMSTAPYLTTKISVEMEISRLIAAIRTIKKNSPLPISADTSRSAVAEAALKAGAKILNDVTGLTGDLRMASVAKKAQGLILMAHPTALPPSKKGDPIGETTKIFRKILQIARQHKISEDKIVLDPGIGFFRNRRLEWWRWDLEVLASLKRLLIVGSPLLVGVSRKSFIGHITGQKNPEGRLPGSLAATALAVMNGASIIRTHDVAEARQAILIASAINSSCPRKRASMF